MRKNYGVTLEMFKKDIILSGEPEKQTERKDAMPNKTTPPKVTNPQKIENLTNYIHALQDRLDENKRLIAKQTEIIEGQRHIIEGQRDIIDAQRLELEAKPAASITAPQTTERGRQTRRLWQTRRRRPGRE